jgi:hypothetical protein
MTSSKTHKTIDVRNEDINFIEEIRKTPYGNISYAEAFHTIVLFWKENH